ncbi:MAG: hypothetical protein J1E85_06270 [Ruminococcus sp.]|nr:hypothetical protein [Ruminococcus sp.]
MKLFADYKIKDGYKKINIWYIYNSYKAYIKEEKYIKFEDYYKKFFKGRLYSTHRVNKIPMTLTKKHPYGKSFFKYRGNINDRGRSESINHSTYKEIIKELYILNLVINNKQIKLYVSYSDIEYDFTANGNNYSADVYICFYKSVPEEYLYRWNGKLLLEIQYTHAIEKEKVRDCYVEGLPVFEHTISEKLKMNEYTSSEEELINQKNFIKEKLSEKIYGKLLSDPELEDYYSMIEKLKTENNELKKHNELLLKINKSQFDRIKALENDSNELKNNNEHLIKSNKAQAEKIKTLEKENDSIKIYNNSSLNDKYNQLLIVNNFQSSKIVSLQHENSKLINYKNSIEKHKFIKFLLKLGGIK